MWKSGLNLYLLTHFSHSDEVAALALKNLPLQRSTQLVVQRTPESTRLTDIARAHRSYSLNPVLAAIWSHCDGRRSTEALAEIVTEDFQAPISPEIILYALSELRREALLAPQPGPARPRPTGRRELVQHLGADAAYRMPVLTAIVPPSTFNSFGCVLPDTPVQLAGGSFLNAGQVVAGQWLAGFDPDAGKLRPARVKAIHQLGAPHTITLFTHSGDFLQASPSHLLLAGLDDPDGTPVADLLPGDPLLVFSADLQRIVPTTLAAIQRDPHPQRVFALEMDTPEHTFLTGGIVSHNKTHLAGPQTLLTN